MTTTVIIFNLLVFSVAMILWNAKLHGDNLRLKVELTELKLEFLRYQDSVRKAVKEFKISH